MMTGALQCLPSETVATLTPNIYARALPDFSSYLARHDFPFLLSEVSGTEVQHQQ